MDYNFKTLPWGTSTEQWSLTNLLLTQPPKIIGVWNYNDSEHPLGLCMTACLSLRQPKSRPLHSEFQTDTKARL